MNETIKLDDMRVFAHIAESGSLSEAARRLRMPKQTVSRRLAALERALGSALVQRTTRRLRLTEVGQGYAQRCVAMSRLAEEANEAVVRGGGEPRGTLRVTADPTFGEAFLPGLLEAIVREHSKLTMEVVLTSRHVDLVEEGFDVAFRVGRLEDSSLVATRLGPARLRYCASPDYLERHGEPADPNALVDHECIELAPHPGPTRWPFAGPEGLFAVAVSGRLRVSSVALAQNAALDGLGIVNLPAFAAGPHLRAGRLCAVLEAWEPEIGGIHLVYPGHRILAPKVRAFVDRAVAQFRGALE